MVFHRDTNIVRIVLSPQIVSNQFLVTSAECYCSFDSLSIATKIVEGLCIVGDLVLGCTVSMGDHHTVSPTAMAGKSTTAGSEPSLLPTARPLRWLSRQQLGSEQQLSSGAEREVPQSAFPDSPRLWLSNNLINVHIHLYDV